MLSLNYEIIGIIGSGICSVKIITVKIIGITGSITVKITGSITGNMCTGNTCAHARSQATCELGDKQNHKQTWDHRQDLRWEEIVHRKDHNQTWDELREEDRR